MLWEQLSRYENIYQHPLANPSAQKCFPDEGEKQYMYKINFIHGIFHIPYAKPMVIYDILQMPYI